MKLPIEFQTVDEIEAIIISGIGLDEPIDKRRFVILLSEMCQEIFDENAELLFNSKSEVFFTISEELVLKLEYDEQGLIFSPVFPVSNIEHWLSCWIYDIRVIYFVGNVLRTIEKLGFNPDGSKKKTKK